MDRLNFWVRLYDNGNDQVRVYQVSNGAWTQKNSAIFTITNGTPFTMTAEVRSLCGKKSYAAAASALDPIVDQVAGSAEGKRLAGIVYYNASLQAFLDNDCGSSQTYADKGAGIGSADCTRMQENIRKSGNCTKSMIKTMIKRKEKFKGCP